VAVSARLASAVDAFHLFWAFLLAVSGPLSWIPALRPWTWAIIGGTVASQLLWLGCPLTLLAARLRGDDHYIAFTDRMILRLGIEVPPWLLSVQLVAFIALAVPLAQRLNAWLLTQEAR
jgi:hypothetical protein